MCCCAHGTTSTSCNELETQSDPYPEKEVALTSQGWLIAGIPSPEPGSWMALEAILLMDDPLLKHAVEKFFITVQRRKGASKIGLEIRHLDQGGCEIIRLKEGILTEWNITHRDQQVREGDLILEVNGKCTFKEILAEFSSDRELTILISQSLAHAIVPKNGGCLAST